MTGNHQKNGNGAKPEVQPDLFSTVPVFPGFEHLSSNFTYTPNQFFDVCLPHYSRGVVRLVAYMIRQTLGYCDPSGTPQRSRLQVSWSDIERDAGLSRRAIPEAVEEAIKGELIVCLSPAIRDQKGVRAQSAVYSLKHHAPNDGSIDPSAAAGAPRAHAGNDARAERHNSSGGRNQSRGRDRPPEVDEIDEIDEKTDGEAYARDARDGSRENAAQEAVARGEALRPAPYVHAILRSPTDSVPVRGAI
ncbi:MAG: hypothetical protein ABIT38_20295 [Gemmatimonadaceae bacterium]